MEPLSFENTKDDDSLKKKERKKNKQGLQTFYIFILPPYQEPQPHYVT